MKKRVSLEQSADVDERFRVRTRWQNKMVIRLLLDSTSSAE
jgi:hypothetical protein